MTIQIIGYIQSGYTLKVISTLLELGIPYEIIIPDKFADIKTPEYLATKHPFGKIPVLIDDGFQLYESHAIARYLVNKYQGTKNSTVLIPSDIQKAALVEQFISVGRSYHNVPVAKLITQEISANFLGGTLDPEIIKEAREETSKVLDVYEKLLEGKDYLTGEFSLADLLHCPYYCVTTGYDDLWNDPKRPNVARWWKNMSERESWKKIIYELENIPGDIVY
ncbi:glutathione S-transferase [Glomus cerebriforme]|uniref:glutathione transferase n=1 Tax=Glomus cerebriforme TaxID=658196 RepID=A0A397SGM7_9GLOM|nr:glutathione S-transferase [Glomus cerebriforme]